MILRYKNNVSAVLLTIFLFATLISAKERTLPSFIKACKRNDPNLAECAVKNANFAIEQMTDENLKIIGLNSVRPFVIPQLKIEQSNTGLSITIRNMSIYGLETMRLTNAKYDLPNKHIEYQMEVDKVTLTGDYEFSGTILILPIRGRGPGNITCSNLKVTYGFDFILEKRKNKEYMKIVKSQTFVKPDKFYFKFSNLFDGNEALNRNLKQFLKDNSDEVGRELLPDIQDTMNEFIVLTMNRLGKLYTYDVIYPK